MHAVANLSGETCRFLMIVTRPALRTCSAPDATTCLAAAWCASGSCHVRRRSWPASPTAMSFAVIPSLYRY